MDYPLIPQLHHQPLMAMEIIVELLEIELKGRHGFELFTLFFRERCTWCSSQDDLAEIVRNRLIATLCPVLDDAPFGIVYPECEGRMADWRGGFLPGPDEWFLVVFFFVHIAFMASAPFATVGRKASCQRVELGVS